MTSLSRKRKADFLAVAFLTLVCCALFADVIFGQRDFFIRDLTRYYHPTKSVLRQIVLSGEFPWWNPYYAAGQPMAANPEYEVFYPLQWFILLPNFETGYRFHILIHVWLCAVAMYALLRSMRLRPWPSLFGAISWGYGGLTMSLINLLPILFAAAWLPLVLLFSRQCLRRFRLRDAAFASLAGGMQILVGEPTTLMQTWLIVGLYASWRMLRLRGRGWRAAADPVLIILLVLTWSIAIGSVQLIPAIDHAGDTVRSRGFDLDLVTAWSFPPQRMLEIVYPHVFGRIDADGRTLWWGGSGLYGRPASPFFFSIHLGMMLVALVAAGLATARSGRGRWVWFVIPFFILAVGRFTPLYGWLNELNVSIPFRYPEKFLLSVLFGTVVFGSVLFGKIETGHRRLARRASLFALIGFAVAASVVVISFTPFYDSIFTELWGIERSRFKAEILRVSRADWRMAALGWVVAAAVFGARLKMHRAARWAPLAVAILTIELIPVGLDASPRIQRHFYESPDVAQTLLGDRDDFRIFHEVDWYGRSPTARKWFSTGRGVYWVVRNGLFPMTNGNHAIRTVLERDYDRTALLPTVDLVRSMWDVRDRGQKQWASIFMEMSNAVYRARYRDFEGEIERVEDDLRNIRPIRFREGGPAPRYYFADELFTISNREEFVEHLVRETPAPRTAFVSFERFAPASGDVSLLSETSSTVRLRVDARGEAFLVLAVTPHRYWKATVDGSAATLHTTNIGYQGLRVPEGTHEVVICYRNPVVMAMAPVSLVGFLGALVVVGSGVRRRDQPGFSDRRST